MKILLIAACSQPYQNGSFVRKYLERLGHQVLAFDYRLHPALPLGCWPVLKSHWVYPFIYRAIPSQHKQLIRQTLDFKPEMILTIKGESILPQTIRYLKQHTKATSILWCPDDPHLFKSVSRYIAPAYDIVITSSQHLIPRYQQLGIKRVEMMGFACDPEVHRRVELTPQEQELYGADICFVGSCYPSRLRFLRKLADFNVKIWGPHWYPMLMGKLSRHLMGHGLYHTKMVKAFNAAKIVLNVHLHHKDYWGTNARTYEATGCGAFLLSDYAPGLEQIFKIGREIECFKSEDELADKVRYYLNNPRPRDEIAQAGQLRAYREYSFENRVQQILSLL